MKGRIFAWLPVLLVAAAILALPTEAAAPGKAVQVGANAYMAGARPIDPPDQSLPELQPVKPGHEMITNTADGKTLIKWQIKSTWCISGGKVWLAIDGKWVGWAKKKGTYNVGYVKNGRYHSFYAEDQNSTVYWGTSTYYIYTYWSWFMWIIKC
ncbi:MAG: hypothetical protein HYX75_09285 [Acidobacteria bacterium]|nr:hypothetical protein [Acidobacteriota bacterium]